MRGFDLRQNGDSVALPLSAQRLVVFVALEDRPVLRGYVAGMLWLDASEERAGASLRSALWRAQRSGCPVLRANAVHVALAPGVAVDAYRVAERARRLIADDAIEPGDLEALCHAGDLLPDWYDDWLAIERERLRQLRLHALEALCARMSAAGRHAEAAEAGLAAVAAAPLRESAHRALIRVHLDEGNVGEARRQYEIFARLASRHFGLEPTAALRGLVG